RGWPQNCSGQETISGGSARDSALLDFSSGGHRERLSGAKGGIGIVAVGRVQGIIRVVPVGGIEGIVGRVAIRRIDGVAGIKAVDRVEGIIRREDLRGIQRIVRRIPTGRIEDIVVALVLLREVLLSKGGSDLETAYSPS
ncbi:MAG: hypothetical protein ABL965_03590, partial [Nitrospira sp.]